jgi:flagellar assembly protein FliH
MHDIPRRRSTVLKARTDAIEVFETTPLPSEPVNGILLDDRLVSEAREAGYRAGFDAGYQAGHDEGLQAAAISVQQAEAVRAAQLQPALAALDLAVQRFDAEQSVAFAQVEDSIATAAFLLTEALLGRELALASSPGRDAIARALRLAPERLDVTISLNPDDLATVETGDDLAPGRHVTLVPDPTLASGDARVAVGACRIEAILADAVERVRAALEVPQPGPPA